LIKVLDAKSNQNQFFELCFPGNSMVLFSQDLKALCIPARLYRVFAIKEEFSSVLATGTLNPGKFYLNFNIFVFRNGIPSICFYFCSTERNSELFSLPRNGSERNSESLILFLFHGTELRAFFFSAEWFGTEFREFSDPWNSRNSAGTNQLFRLFCLLRK
jgi:hypothetical protein